MKWISVEESLPLCTKHYYDNVYASEWFPVQIESVKGWMRGQLLEYRYDGGCHYSWVVDNCPAEHSVTFWFPLHKTTQPRCAV